MSNLFEQYLGSGQLGKDITIGDYFPEIFISDSGEVFCYTGIYLEEEPHQCRDLLMLPHSLCGKHSTDKTLVKKPKAFFRLADGCILLDDYVDARFGGHAYKRIAAGIRFPTADAYYGVWIEHKEDAALTRAVFGLTYAELSMLLEGYAKTLGTFHDFAQYPRLTRSIRSNNRCDLTGLWIPERFPYITFQESPYMFSHISLWGFYRHLQLLTACKMTSAFSCTLLEAEVDPAVLQKLFVIGRSCNYQVKASWDMWADR